MKNVLLLSLTVLTLVLTGCGNQRNMATVTTAPEAEQIFLQPDTQENYTFYAHGPDAEPIALLALEKNYRLQSDFWFALKPNEASRKRWANLVHDSSYRSGSEYRGVRIASAEAVTVGYILSNYHWITAWFDEEDSTTVIIPPPELSGQQPIPLPLARSRQ